MPKKREQVGYTYLNIESENIIIGQLYETQVVIFDTKYRNLKLNPGGFHTRSTVKAMNTTLSRAGILMTVRIKDGAIIWQNTDPSVVVLAS